MRQNISIYRQLHVLERLFNDFIIRACLPIMLSVMPGIQIMSMFGCFRFLGKMTLLQFQIFPLMGFSAMLCNVVSSTLSSFIFTDSTALMTCFKTAAVRIEGSKREGKILRRELWSCTSLKIKFGSNFVDGGTPLVLQDFCWTQTVSLMLVMDNK